MSQLKQIILVRGDLKMSKGKIAAQVAHASVECVFLQNKKLVENWRKSGMKKIVLKVENLEELENFLDMAKKKDLVTSKICDCGLTEIEPNTITCGAIGPAPENLIDDITKNLKPL